MVAGGLVAVVAGKRAEGAKERRWKGPARRMRLEKKNESRHLFSDDRLDILKARG